MSSREERIQTYAVSVPKLVDGGHGVDLRCIEER
jgi:hypothetical protein